MIRTDLQTKNIHYFLGAHSFVDPFLQKDFFAEWVEGFVPTIRGELERIKGKQLFREAPYETVFTITSLEFAYRTVVLIHSGSDYYVEEDLTNLQTNDFTINPLEALIPV